MALSLGNTSVTNSSSSPATVTLSYNAGSIIILDVTSNSATAGNISASSAALGAYTKHATGGTSPNLITRFWLSAPTGQTSDVTTITATGANFIVGDIYEIRGANTTTPFDAGGPQTSTGVDPGSITTQLGPAMVIAAFRSSTATMTAGSGFNLIQGTNFTLTEYQILSTPQTLSCTIGTGVGTATGWIVDGVVQAGIGGVTPFLATQLF